MAANEVSLAFALTAGVVAAFNPCGFALLPAYLSYSLGQSDRTRPGSGVSNLMAALGAGAAVSAGFVATFGAAGAATLLLSLPVQRYAPWVTVPIGLGLVVLGVVMVRGFQPSLTLPRFQRRRAGGGLRSMFLFGISYATVSLSCTLPVFLAAVATTFVNSSPAVGLVTFGAYGLGMGLVLMAATVAIALAREGALRRIKPALRYVGRASGVLLILAGAYVAYYGYYTIRTEGGADLPAGPIAWVEAASSSISGWVARAGSLTTGLTLAAVLGVGVILAVAVARAGRRRTRTNEQETL